MTDRRSTLLELARAVAPDQGVTVPAAWLVEALQAALADPPAPEEWLTVHQAAARMHVSAGYLYRKRKVLPFAEKVSHRVLRFNARGLDEWMAGRSKRGRAA